MQGTRICQWSDLPADVAQGVTRRGVQGQGASVKQVEVPAGFVGERHSHDHEQFVIVLAGSGTLDSDAGSVRLNPGTVIHFAPNAWHSVVFDTETVLMEINLAA